MQRCTDEREAQVRALLPLVRAIARRVHRLVPSVEIDDLIGDGSIGLIRAVDGFDPSRGPSLKQYARQVIAGAMLNGVRRMDPVPERVRRTLRQADGNRAHAGYERAALIAHRAAPLSLDAPLPEGEAIRADWSRDPAKLVTEGSAREELRSKLQALPRRQREILVLHYYRERSLREIGERMTISPQRASQLHLAAIQRLRKRYDAAAY